jgi:hypothetical protein
MKRIVIAVLPAAWLVRGAGATFAANPGTQVSQGQSASARPRRLSQAARASGSAFNEDGGIAGSVYAGQRNLGEDGAERSRGVALRRGLFPGQPEVGWNQFPGPGSPTRPGLRSAGSP